MGQSLPIPTEFQHKGAEFSFGRNHRYSLWRIWDDKKPLLMIIGLNPSTANETDDDPTINKVIKVANNNDFGGIYMMNLFSIVSADPEVLRDILNIQNAHLEINDKKLNDVAANCARIVFAWGKFPEARERAKEIIKRFSNPVCFKQNKDGSPKHPLYCLDTSEFIPFNPELINHERKKGNKRVSKSS